jgi:gamma-glutamylcyclotransferase (GGCT)/AIG2-like uncharacterized protein YtfP
MRHYFAYGSNMDRAHMAKLCPRAEARGLALIKDHRFFIAHGGYGSIASKRGSSVHGVLWRIAARDLIALDAYEAIGDGLYQHALLPVHFDNKLLRALVYIANDARPGRPSVQYRDAVLEAARDWALPDDYIRTLEKELALP